MIRFVVFVGFLAAEAVAWSQHPRPAVSNVSLGHIHLIATDRLAVRHLWIEILGAKPANQGDLHGVLTSGTHIWIEKGLPSGGTDGSTIRDVGLRVRDLDAVLDHAAQNNLHARRTSRNSAHLWAPNGVLLELIGDSDISEPTVDHLHLLVPDASAARRWYDDHFGYPISGVRLDFINAGTAGGPTKGRAVDHLGFDVDNLDKYMDSTAGRSATSGILSLRPVSVFIVDPWGTRIEVTEKAEEHARE